MTKPYAEIRKTLVEGIRNSDKPATVKHHAEILISAITCIEKEGENADNLRAFQAAHARLMQVSGLQ